MAQALSETLPAVAAAAGTLTQKTLPAAKLLPAIPARVGVGDRVSKTATGGGGIDSPLTETAYADRTWYSAGIKSTDGLFTLPAIKSIKMTDAGNNEVILNFKAPP